MNLKENLIEEEIKFKIHKFSARKRCDIDKTDIICCFSEFGCETISVLYCIPRIIQDRPSNYRIVVGWSGRAYLYRHLADEFWEIDEKHMWLREYAKAFHHESRNLSKIENNLKKYGTVVPSSYLGRIAISTKCFDCRIFYNFDGKSEKCDRCGSTNILPSILGDVNYWKKKILKLPDPSMEKMKLAEKYLIKKSVGVFARNRKCYGRNLQPIFYKKLVKLLRNRGYEPIWLGEKESTLACPVSNVVDFSRMKEARDLELTLAIIKKCEFTVQFWTASSRLSGILGVPYLLFESPDQIWGQGQEGIRRNLCDFGKRKLSVNHYLNVEQNNDLGLKIVDKCIEEMENDNYNDYFGLVDKNIVQSMKNNNAQRIGDNGCF